MTPTIIQKHWQQTRSILWRCESVRITVSKPEVRIPTATKVAPKISSLIFLERILIGALRAMLAELPQERQGSSEFYAPRGLSHRQVYAAFSSTLATRWVLVVLSLIHMRILLAKPHLCLLSAAVSGSIKTVIIIHHVYINHGKCCMY